MKTLFHADTAPDNLTRPQFLLIDDTPINIEVLGAILGELGQVKFALSGRDGLALLAQAPPDLIFLDVMMPDMDGYAVMAAIQAAPPEQRVPVIFVTAHDDPESETRALAAGAADFISKPINRQVVLARTRLQLELARYRHHLEALVDSRTRALAQARDDAQSANRAKSVFLANVGHELKTPLTKMAGFAELLTQEPIDEPARDYAATIHRAARELAGLVDNLLTLTDLEAGQVQLACAPFALRPWLQTLALNWQEAVQAKGLTLHTSVASELPETLHADPRRLGQVLGALLSNAVKFSQQGGPIMLRALPALGANGAPALRLEVQDPGVGIAPEVQARMFRLFEQGDNSATRRFEGCGLGLALCQRLAALMQADIGFTSQPGQGSTFWIQL